MAERTTRPKQCRMGRNGHQVSRKHRRMWLPTKGELYGIRKEIRVRTISSKTIPKGKSYSFLLCRNTLEGQTFPCYYSRAYPEMVVARYSWDDNLTHLILSLIIPNVLFAISIGVLSYWYCPCCDKACHKSPRVYAEKYPTKEK